MLTTAEATQAIRAVLRPLPATTVALSDATGCILRQSVIAERDQPPFDRVMMDGIALSFIDFESGQLEFPIQAMQAAGDPPLTLEHGQAIEIMTGAALPAGADCIVPVERIDIRSGVARVEAGYEVIAKRFVHPRGSDHRQGKELLQSGARIGPMEIAVIASAGLDSVNVCKNAAISVLSTGNELVAAGQPIADHQVRLSNGPAIVSMLAENGFRDTQHEHICDDLDALRSRIAMHLEAADVLILSGGVSMGKADFVPQVLDELGVKVVFHRISQRPGKPMWFGTGPEGQAVFALPGNPVSTLVCCRQYVIPALQRMTGMPAPKPQFAALTQDVSFGPALTNFLPVRLLSNAAGQVLAMPVHTNTSGDFASLAGTDGYVELALESSSFVAGSAVPLHRWRL